MKDPSIVRRTFCQHFMNPCSEFHPSLVPFPSRQLYPINTTTYVSGGHTSHGLARYLSFNLSQSAQWLVLSNVISLSSPKWLLGCNFTGKQWLVCWWVLLACAHTKSFFVTFYFLELILFLILIQFVVDVLNLH